MQLTPKLNWLTIIGSPSPVFVEVLHLQGLAAGVSVLESTLRGELASVDSE